MQVVPIINDTMQINCALLIDLKYQHHSHNMLFPGLYVINQTRFDYSAVLK